MRSERVILTSYELIFKLKFMHLFGGFKSYKYVMTDRTLFESFSLKINAEKDGFFRKSEVFFFKGQSVRISEEDEHEKNSFADDLDCFLRKFIDGPDV